MSNGTALTDFLSAAKQQEAIDVIVAQCGNDMRAVLEQKMFTELDGGAAICMQEQDERQRDVALLHLYIKTAIGPILEALKDLPADQNGCRFVLDEQTIVAGNCTLSILLQYNMPEQAAPLMQQPAIGPKGPNLEINFSKNETSHTAIEVEVADSSQTLYHHHSHQLSQYRRNSPLRLIPADIQDLRTMIGCWAARVAPHRVADLIALIEPPSASGNSAPKPNVAQHMIKDSKRFKLPPQRKPGA